MNLGARIKKVILPKDLEARVQALPTRLGSYGYDPWGFHQDTFKLGLALFKRLYDHYFRVQALGLEHIPRQGRLLVVPNHSGQLPIDGILIGIAMATSPHGPRIARTMVERFFPTLPYIGNLLSQVGAMIGDPANCIRMLENEEAVLVFPEGVRGSGKPFRQRYELQRFGNGFMHIALRTRTPIIPVGVVGCEETMPSLGNFKALARLLQVPYVPLALPFPLPARVTLNFGAPMVFEAQTVNETVVTELVEQVKARIRDLIQKGRDERKGIYR